MVRNPHQADFNHKAIGPMLGSNNIHQRTRAIGKERPRKAQINKVRSTPT